MIISRILGGLGNQLFQYAAGRALALQYKTELLLDVTSFEGYKLRNFDLAAFNTVSHFAEPDMIRTIAHRNFLQKVRDNILPMAYRKVYREPHFHFHQRFFEAPASIYLKGYWQSEKYFAPFAETIRHELTLKPEHISKVSVFASELQQGPSVSVHIRRGDYKNPAIIEMHGILTAAYYQSAITIIQEKYPASRFYFFSDDMQWVKENLVVDNAIYVSGKIAQTHLEDFFLMSQCKHNIIANSSFSWWAAWLNNNPDKIVIAPKKWFNTAGPKDTQDLIPPGWLQI